MKTEMAASFAGSRFAVRGANWLIGRMRVHLDTSFLRRFLTLATLTGLGQFSFVAALPLLTRLYAPAEFGAFAIYLSAVNLAGPLLSLKYDSALYASANRTEAAHSLALAFATLICMTVTACGVVWLFHAPIERHFGTSGLTITLLLPAGMLLSGGWSVFSAWAVHKQASTTLGLARLIQPLLMTVLQLAGGLIIANGAILVAAHLMSHLVYSSFIARRELTRADLALIRDTGLREILNLAHRHLNFPLFALPAQLSSLCVSNLPLIVLSAFYGAEISGHFGVAYRLVLAPLTVASMPLGALLVGSLMRTEGAAERRALTRKVFAINIALVAAPLLVLGSLAPALAPKLLGGEWRMTGQVVAALSFLGAAQALATPFAEATSLFAAQRLRFVVDGLTAIFVVGCLIVCGLEGMEPLRAIWVMSLTGALISTTGLTLVLSRVTNARN